MKVSISHPKSFFSATALAFCLSGLSWLTCAAKPRDAGRDLTNYSIKFIESSIFGDFIMVKDLVLKRNYTVHGIPANRAKSFCTCRNACWTQGNCKGFSIEPENDGHICRITNKSPHLTSFRNITGGQFVYKTGSIAKRRYYKVNKNDGLLYLALHFRNGKVYSEALEECKKFPGHRLVRAVMATQKTALEEILGEVNSSFNDNNLGVWTNNMDNEQYPNQTVYMYSGEHEFLNVSVSDSEAPKSNVICQANPLDLEW